MVTAFPAHAYELLAEAVNLDWPERPIDTLESWRMVNVAARPNPAGGPAPLASSQRAVNPTLRDLVGQVGARIGGVLGLPNAERLDTVEAVVRAVSEAPLPTTGAQVRGLIILGLPELCEKARLEENEQRQLLLLGARVSLAYRGRSLLLLSPQAAALSLALPPIVPPPSATAMPEVSLRSLDLLDLDHVADPYSVHRLDEKMRTELEQALTSLLLVREGAGAAVGSPQPAVLANAAGVPAALRALMDVTGTDLRLVAECMPIVEQALRERTRAPLSASAFESRVGTYLSVVWSALPLPHRLYLAALCSDSVDLDVADVRPGMVVDAPVYSISGKDRLPTSKVVTSAGVRLDQRTIDDLTKVMWLKKVRIRGSLQDSRTVLWTYLKQTRPRLRGRPATEETPAREGARNGERWLDQAAADLKRLGVLRTMRLTGEEVRLVLPTPEGVRGRELPRELGRVRGRRRDRGAAAAPQRRGAVASGASARSDVGRLARVRAEDLPPVVRRARLHARDPHRHLRQRARHAGRRRQGRRPGDAVRADRRQCRHRPGARDPWLDCSQILVWQPS